MLQHHQKGFTLLETIIYVGIITIVITAFMVFALNITDIRTRAVVQQEVHANSRFALNIMTQHIRDLYEVNANSIFGVDPGVLEFTTTSIADYTILFDLNKDNGTLRITDGAITAQALTSNRVRVNTLVFQELELETGVKQIVIRMNVGYNSSSTDPIYSYSEYFQTSVTIR